MKYRAICPSCGLRLPRRWYWGLSMTIRRCPGCLVSIQQNGRWDRIANVSMGIVGAITCIACAIAGAILAMSVVGACGGVLLGVGCMLALGHVLFPYVSPYVQVIDRLDGTDFHFCRTCGYNLTANTSGVCPECGTPTQFFSP
jgi:hypothetical protein